jgi:hypothetical protein
MGFFERFKRQTPEQKVFAEQPRLKKSADFLVEDFRKQITENRKGSLSSVEFTNKRISKIVENEAVQYFSMYKPFFVFGIGTNSEKVQINSIGELIAQMHKHGNDVESITSTELTLNADREKTKSLPKVSFLQRLFGIFSSGKDSEPVLNLVDNGPSLEPIPAKPTLLLTHEKVEGKNTDDAEVEPKSFEEMNPEQKMHFAKKLMPEFAKLASEEIEKWDWEAEDSYEGKKFTHKSILQFMAGQPGGLKMSFNTPEDISGFGGLREYGAGDIDKLKIPDLEQENL